MLYLRHPQRIYGFRLKAHVALLYTSHTAVTELMVNHVQRLSGPKGGNIKERTH